MIIRSLAAATAVAGLAACATLSPDMPAFAATQLISGSGADMGTARLTRAGGAATVELDARGLTPGQHGVHLHTVGRCDPPDFSSAEGHWNPTGAGHGRLGANGPHGGDLGNVTVGGDGTVRTSLPLPLGTRALDDLLDADGAALVIHSGRDDLRTDPSGDSGSRVTCGVLRPV